MEQLAVTKESRNWQWLLIALGAILILVSGILWWTQGRETSTQPASTNAPAVEDDTEPSNDFVNLALTRAQTGDVDGALEALGIAIAADPAGAAEAYYYRGLIYAELGELDKALADFDSGIAANQHMPELYAARGTTYASRSRPATALDDFHKAIQLAPDHAPTYVNRGQAYMSMGEPDLAMADFNYALELDPALVAAYFNRGVLHMEMSKPELALDDFNTCIELAPETPAPYFNRAVAYTELNELELAATDLVIYLDKSDDEMGRHQAEALLASLTNYEENSHLDE